MMLAGCIICKGRFNRTSTEKYCSAGCRRQAGNRRSREKRLMERLSPGITASRHRSVDRITKKGYAGTSHVCKKCGREAVYDRNDGMRQGCAGCGRTFRIGDLECVGCGRDTTRPELDLGLGWCVCPRCADGRIRLSRRDLAALASKYHLISTSRPYLRITLYQDVGEDEAWYLRERYGVRLARTADREYEMTPCAARSMAA